jgi:hypothetical protein
MLLRCGGSCVQSNLKNVQVLVAENDERTTKDKRRTTNERTDWSEFWTNDEWRVQCCDRRERVWRREICQSVKCSKKIGVDWPRPSQFRKKNFQRVNVQIEKSAWTGLGKVKRRASSAASVFNFLQDWSPGGRRSVLHFDGLPLTRGVVVATPFAAAVSLTFSLVKN